MAIHGGEGGLGHKNRCFCFVLFFIQGLETFTISLSLYNNLKAEGKKKKKRGEKLKCVKETHV